MPTHADVAQVEIGGGLVLYDPETPTAWVQSRCHVPLPEAR